MSTVFWCAQEFETALKFTSAILKAEPSNRQAQQLQAFIHKKLRNGLQLYTAVFVVSWPLDLCYVNL